MPIVASSRREPARKSNERETIMTTTDRPAADGVCLFFASTTEGNRGREKVFMWLVLGVNENFPDDLTISVKYY
jgi:hypothetical protein